MDGSVTTVNMEIFAQGLFLLNSRSRNFPEHIPHTNGLAIQVTKLQVTSPMEIIILGAKCY